MIYKYKAITKNGEVIEGYFEGQNKTDVLNMIKSNNYLPVSVERDIESDAQVKLFSPKVKKKDLAIFCRQFYTMIDAGVGIFKSLEILETQTRNKLLKEALVLIHEDVQKGFSLSGAMKKHAKVFPPILINMVEAGELSGTLDSILERMALHYEKEYKLENKIKSALIYPMALIVVTISVVIFMLVAVLPTFIDMFDGSGVDLPWPTKFLLNINNFINVYWYILVGIIVGLLFFVLIYARTEEGRKGIDKLKISIPGIRITNIKIITARFTRTLSTLMASGIPLIQALETIGRVIDNRIIEDKLKEGIVGIKKGVSLSRTVKDIDIFPPMVDSMIKIGEESGALDDMLYKTADFYDEEVEVSLQRMTTLIEPILLVVMAIIIGFVVVAMALPMFEMTETI